MNPLTRLALLLFFSGLFSLPTVSFALTFEAERIELKQQNGETHLELRSDVQVELQDLSVRASLLFGLLPEGVFYAPGRVEVENEEMRFTGERLLLSRPRRFLSLLDVQGRFRQVFLRAGRVEQTQDKLAAESASATTCRAEKPHYLFSSAKVSVEGEKLSVHRAAFHLFGKKLVRLPTMRLRVGGEKDRSALPLPALGYSRRDGVVLKGEYGFPLHDFQGTARLYFPIEKDPFLSAELEHERAGVTTMIKAGRLRTYDKNFVPLRLTLVSGSMRWDPSPFYLGVGLGYFSEDRDIQSPRLFLGGGFVLPLSAGKEGQLDLILDHRINWYRRGRPYQVFSSRLSWKKGATEIWYAPHSRSGQTPFRFDELDAREEMGVQTAFQRPSFETSLRLRYDNERDTMQTAEINIKRVWDCLALGVGVEARKKHFFFLGELRGF